VRRASPGGIILARVDPTSDNMPNNAGEDVREEEVNGLGSYLAGARAAMPFALATFVLGVSFGVLARSLGWGIVAPIVFSIIAFSGSAQFAVAAVLGAGGGAPEVGRSRRSWPLCCSMLASGRWGWP
jgi:AzlC protein